MAKKTVATLQKKGGRGFAKVIKMEKGENGNYSFKESMVPTEKVNDFLK